MIELIILVIGIITMSTGAYMIYPPAGLILLGFLILKISWPDKTNNKDPGGDN